ncbi:hypothetical protein E3C22_19740 [Jiella endophytica]|uniref:Uncharacterized protein n=1 Tax=Jiella endophytica TaxID=2558362 RepID=A0A4Y8RF93_9HYPH|nr:hypothetical protein [Jiella endophytica]TFF19893.1 hypothetical protein E3C22_19740 [Jiella endophytica]
MPRAANPLFRPRLCRSIPGGVTRLAASVVVTALLCGPGAAQSVLKLGGTDAPQSGSDTSCGAAKYHAALAAIRDREYQSIKEAREDAGKPDESLPGHLVFNPIVTPKSGDARRALIAANQLARSQNRPAWLASKDSRWIVGEVGKELGRYLGQEETEYLCGGVPDYLDTMRKYLARAGSDASSLDDLKAAQAAVASDSILATLHALRPVPLPTAAPSSPQAPSEAPPTPAAELRPAVGIAGRDQVAAETPPAAATPATTGATQTALATDAATASDASANAGEDPDLPPLSQPKPITLASDDDRLAALDRLVEAAKQSGALSEDVAAGAETADQGDAAAESPATPDAAAAGANGRPVIARLEELRPLVYGSRPAISDLAARRQLIDSFSSIEVLDYLDHRPAESEDSVPAAIGRTIDAISTAHSQSCGCSKN